MKLNLHKDLQLVCRGDRRAAEELILKTYNSVFNYLSRLCGDMADAEDLTQDTYARVWHRLSRYEGRCSFKTWVHRIAYHVYIDWIRTKIIQTVQPEWWDGGEDTRPGPFEQTLKKRESVRLYRLVETLPEEQRQVIHLHYYQGLSLRDTAYVTDTALSTVKYRLRKALDFLKSKIKATSKN